ncbi:MAG: methyltetrahydrofolate cobalamin methyltransferase [Deltaproteobacteria bacterium]|nr:methyltetrahydrofolate cobalamin methyltransferase [Deltaproteobacteria bacterium]
MLIVGELINASRKLVASAIEAQDEQSIRKLARAQAENGAHYIDVNAGVFQRLEAEYLRWLIENVQGTVDLPCCIDSPDPRAIEACLSAHRGTAMINSISLERKRCDDLLPLVAGTDLKIVALCMGDSGMPRTAEDRIRTAEELIDRLLRSNVKIENIYVDPLVQPVAVDQTFGKAFLAAIETIMDRFPGVHTICGVSNVSYGLPMRKFLNQTFITMAVLKGLDAAILDPLDKRMMANVVAAEVLAGKDRFCMRFLNSYRDQRLAF